MIVDGKEPQACQRECIPEEWPEWLRKRERRYAWRADVDIRIKLEVRTI